MKENRSILRAAAPSAGAGILIGGAALLAGSGPAAAAIWGSLALLAMLAGAAARERRAETLLLLGAVALTLAAAEVLLRLAWPPALRPVTKIPSAELHHIHRPDAHMYQGFYDGRHLVVRTNEDGFRSLHTRETFRRAPNRIAILGDSFTFGLGVEQDEPFPQVLERMLAARMGAERVSVLNASAVSWSPLIGRRVFESLLAPYAPTEVVYVLDATDIGDDFKYASELVDVGGRTLFDLPPAAREDPYWGALVQVAGGARLIGTLQAPLRGLGLLEGPAPGGPDVYDWYRFEIEVEGVRETNRFFIYRHPLGSTRPWFDATLRNIEELARSVEATGASFTLALMPRFHHWDPAGCPENWEADQYAVDEPFQFAYFEYFDEARDRVGFDIVSLLPAFRPHAGKELTFRIDPHLNGAGHEVAASALAGHLVAKARLR